jgi:two-component system phosphate regulon sensor histidine kinase PhoR
MRALQLSESLNREIDEREKALMELRRMLLDRVQATESLRLSLEDNEQSIRMLRTSISEQESAINAMREATRERQREMDKLQAMLTERDNEGSYRVALALTLANAAYDSLLVLNEDYRIIAINNAAEELFGVARPIGQHITELTRTEEFVPLLDDALLNSESLEEQIQIEKRTYRVQVQVVRREGHLFLALALQDVTDLVRLNRARRDMVANISHELRTPIANIRLIIDSLFHEQEKPKRKQSTSALRAIARETDSLLWLVQELLDLSMIESGQAILRMVETSLTMIVDEAIERMEDQASLKDVQVVSAAPSGLQVLADADQVRRVLLNLIHNAIKWSPSGGTITITADASDEEVTVSVLDTGPGVPEDQTERIFERFYQVDPSRSKGDGTGLGLAICKHIVEAHGGRIWAESNEHGGGGRFRFTLLLPK